MAERSVHEAAVEAVAGALGGRDRNQWRGGYGSIPPDPDAWHYQHGNECSYDVRKAARFAIAALVASAEVREGLVAALSPGRYLWRSPDDAQFASFDRDEMVDAILAALGGTDQPSTKGTP